MSFGVACVIFGCALLAMAPAAGAQQEPPPEESGSLAGMPGLTDTQRELATAAQGIYNTLRPDGEEGVLPPAQQAMFDKLEELVHTANELQDGGVTDRSLRLGVDGLIEAVEWVANEESATKGGLATDTAVGQFGNVAARLGQLRVGGGGMLLSGSESHGHPGTVSLVDQGNPLGGGASSDGFGGPVGAFVNGYYGWGERDPTVRENAYDADYFGMTGGVDLRLNDQVVVGVATGVSHATADFDRSRSVVDGEANANAVIGSLYGMYDVGSYYLNGILTVGLIEYDITRRIDYPSNNPSVPATDETARGDPGGRQILTGLTGGYLWQFAGTSVGLSGRLNYLRIHIDDYRESGAGPFNLHVGEQRIESLRSTLGLEMSRVFNMDFGVLQPAFRVEWHHEFEDDSRDVTMSFISDPASTRFAAPTDDPDRDFFTVAASVAAVLPRGLQTFAEVETILGLEKTSGTQLTIGVRGEF